MLNKRNEFRLQISDIIFAASQRMNSLNKLKLKYHRNPSWKYILRNKRLPHPKNGNPYMFNVSNFCLNPMIATTWDVQKIH